jgi:transcriptional regulator of heat shock response
LASLQKNGKKTNIFFIFWQNTSSCCKKEYLVKCRVMKDRQAKILQAIVKSFIQTANPVGSKFLQQAFDIPYSPATIRSEMGRLEEEGYIASPHTSAGRIPTEKGFRYLVSHSMEEVQKVRPQMKQEFVAELQKHLIEKRADERMYDIVATLVRLTPNVAFASIPSSKRLFFLGFSNALQQPEFSAEPALTSGIFRVLEDNFREILLDLPVGSQPQVFIGTENLIPEIQSCSLVVARPSGGENFVGILGPMRMDYTRNIAAVETACEFFNLES